MSKVDVLSFGETMAMLVAEETGDLALVERFHKRIAGADSNVAIGLARLGFNVAWLSRVGADSLGRFVRHALQADGLNCQYVTTDTQPPTGFQFKSRVDDGSDPQVEYFRRGSAASHMDRSVLNPQLLEARHVHATGIPPALSASCNELSFELMKSMRAAGNSVSFDPNLRPSLWASEQQMIRDINALAAHADWVLPGLSEGRLLTGFDDPSDIAAF
ncbi:MAG: sugar kinase, partial [Pseudomonas sp.]|nr:sugar kinase [Pseudomonas sp.]